MPRPRIRNPVINNITLWNKSVMITLVCPPRETYDTETTATNTAPQKTSHPSRLLSTLPMVKRFTPT